MRRGPHAENSTDWRRLEGRHVASTLSTTTGWILRQSGHGVGTMPSGMNPVQVVLDQNCVLLFLIRQSPSPHTPSFRVQEEHVASRNLNGAACASRD